MRTRVFWLHFLEGSRSIPALMRSPRNWQEPVASEDDDHLGDHLGRKALAVCDLLSGEGRPVLLKLEGNLLLTQIPLEALLRRDAAMAHWADRAVWGTCAERSRTASEPM